MNNIPPCDSDSCLTMEAFSSTRVVGKFLFRFTASTCELCRAGCKLDVSLSSILHLRNRRTRPQQIMKLKEVHRTATFAWSPFASLPLLATGTVAGALDESFSNESQLEIWAPDFLDKNEFDLGLPDSHGPDGHVADNARPG